MDAYDSSQAEAVALPRLQHQLSDHPEQQSPSLDIIMFSKRVSPGIAVLRPLSGAHLSHVNRTNRTVRALP